jgi:hypothetical protein
MSRARTLAALTLLALALAPAQAGSQANEEEKPIDFEPIPLDEKDAKPPMPSEWQTATRVRFTRKGPRAEGCRAWRTRSWLKIHCDAQTTAASLVGGSFRGVSLWMPEAKEGLPAPHAGQVMFPIKPGDRRIFELFSFGETYGGSMVSPGLVLQEYWIEGEPAPTIVLR